MKEDIHNDKIIREKFEHFSVEPPAHVWTGIQDQLLKSKNTRRMVVLRWISAAAVVLLAFLGGLYFNRTSDFNHKIASKEEVVLPVEKKNKDEIKELESNTISDTPEQRFIASTAKSEKTETKTENRVVASNKPNEQIIQKEQVIVATTENRTRILEVIEFLEKRESAINFSENVESQSLKIKQSEFIVDRLTDEDYKLIASNLNKSGLARQDEAKWKLGMIVSPGYSSQVANHNDLYASNMTYSASDGNANVTGGISVQIKTSKRLSVESGIYYDKNGQKSENSFQPFAMFDKNEEFYYDATPSSTNYFSNNVDVKDGNVVMNSNAGIIAIDNLPNGAEFSRDIESDALAAPKSMVSSGDLSQVFDFIQIPVYMRYKVVDSKFDIEMIGGFNAGLLVGNNAFINNEFGSQNIGKTQDISSLNISGTVGVGLNYKLGKHFSLGVEPRFNYFLTSLNKSSDVNYKPYRIGFYTGIYYEF